MSIICKEVIGLDVKKTSYYTVDRYVVAKGDPANCKSPLGPNWHHEPCFLPAKYKEFAEIFYNFEIRPDDVWNITYPKCGSTWGQEMIYRIANNIHYRDDDPLHTKFIYFEFNTLFNHENSKLLETYKELNSMPSPRYIKSHLPVSLLPKQLWTVRPKIVFTARNPKDAAISFFHYLSRIHEYGGNVQDFLEVFKLNQVVFTPYHNQVLDFWCLRNESNILFIEFEQMKLDLRSVLRKTSKFLGKTYDEDEYEELEHLLAFKTMSENNNSNHSKAMTLIRSNLGLQDTDFNFLRKGEIGSYAADMTAEEIRQFDLWHLQQIEIYRNSHEQCAELTELPNCFTEYIDI